ncbi:MAG: DUF4956 domain-containing protein [Lachnospiraceae bacterium]
MLDSIFLEGSTMTLTASNSLLSFAISLALGFVIAGLYMFRSHYSKSFVMTLVMLPAVVQVVILLVNGNLGVGVAVAGTFSLVRFRSVPGTAREITSIFLAMAVGLAAGMGYLGIAVLLVVVLGAVSMILTITSFGDQRNRKDLRITIPESLNYTDVFDDILKSYAKNWELVQVKTTNMGSLYKLTYQIEMKDTSEEKKMIDELRCCNGNLEISCMTSSFGKEEL